MRRERKGLPPGDAKSDPCDQHIRVKERQPYKSMYCLLSLGHTTFKATIAILKGADSVVLSSLGIQRIVELLPNASVQLIVGLRAIAL